MADETFDWSGRIGEITLGATAADGGSSSLLLPASGARATSRSSGWNAARVDTRLLRLNYVTILHYWSPIVTAYVGDLVT